MDDVFQLPRPVEPTPPVLTGYSDSGQEASFPPPQLLLQSVQINPDIASYQAQVEIPDYEAKVEIPHFREKSETADFRVYSGGESDFPLRFYSPDYPAEDLSQYPVSPDHPSGEVSALPPHLFPPDFPTRTWEETHEPAVPFPQLPRHPLETGAVPHQGGPEFKHQDGLVQRQDDAVLYQHGSNQYQGGTVQQLSGSTPQLSGMIQQHYGSVQEVETVNYSAGGEEHDSEEIQEPTVVPSREGGHQNPGTVVRRRVGREGVFQKVQFLRLDSSF